MRALATPHLPVRATRPHAPAAASRRPREEPPAAAGAQDRRPGHVAATWFPS